MADVPVPRNLGLLVGLGLTGDRATVVERILSGQRDLQTNLVELGRYWKVRVCFSQPVTIYQIPRRHVIQESDGCRTWVRRHSNEVTDHIFAKFFVAGDRLCYLPRRNTTHGYHFPDLSLVTKYEPVVEGLGKQPFTFERFAAKFDHRFITASEIKDLWDKRGVGHEFKRSDFRRFGPEGNRLLRRFMETFAGVSDTEGKGYRECGTEKYLEEMHRTYHRLGRDITISHRLGNGFVNYSSEFQGCGNGRYGVVANMHEYLWTEDD